MRLAGTQSFRKFHAGLRAVAARAMLKPGRAFQESRSEKGRRADRQLLKPYRIENEIVVHCLA